MLELDGLDLVETWVAEPLPMEFGFVQLKQGRGCSPVDSLHSHRDSMLCGLAVTQTGMEMKQNTK